MEALKVKENINYEGSEEADPSVYDFDAVDENSFGWENIGESAEKSEENEKNEEEKNMGAFEVLDSIPEDSNEDEAKARKVVAAQILGGKALEVKDLDINSKEAKRELHNIYRAFAYGDDKDFYWKQKQILKEVETPYEKMGAEAMYDSLKDKKEALRLIFSRVPEAWREMPEASGAPDEEGQKRISLVAIDAFMKKYPTAADLKEAKEEYLKEVSSSESNREDFEAHEEEYDNELDDMGKILFGEQKDYLETVEDIRGNVREKFKEAEGKKRSEGGRKKGETIEVEEEIVDERIVDEGDKGEDKEAEEPAREFKITSYEDLAKEEIDGFVEDYASVEPIGSLWTSPINGMSYGLSNNLLFRAGLSPAFLAELGEAVGSGQRTFVSKAFDIGNGKLGHIVYSLEGEEE